MSPTPADSTETRRVVVTGLGVLVPGGVGCDEAWESACSGREVLSSDGFAGHPCARVTDFDPATVVDRRKTLKLMGPNIQFALAACREAWSRSGREPHHPDGVEAGIVLGVRTRPTDFDEILAVTRGSCAADGSFSAQRFGAEGSSAIFPLSMLRGLPNLVTSQVTIQLGLHGFSDSLTSGEVSGLQAIEEGYRVVRRQGADTLVAGGADDLLDPISLGRLLAEHHRSHDGAAPALSQGAAALVLEERGAATARGAAIHAEVLAVAEGFGGTGGDDALAWTWREALEQAGRPQAAVAAIFLDATLHRQACRVETCMQAVFGEGEAAVARLTQAARIGHSGAAAGAIEATVAVLALSRGRLPGAHEPLAPDAVVMVSSASELGSVVSVVLGPGEVRP